MSSCKFFSSLSGVFGEVPFLLPDVGEGIQTVDIVEWYVVVKTMTK